MIAILAFTQIASWGSIYYAFAILSSDIGRDLDLPAEVVFGGYSWSLLIAGLLAAPVGALLDKTGGRFIMGAGSVFAASGLALLGMADSIIVYLLAWTVMGAAMALVLYEAAFATLTRAAPLAARRSISILTLFGGLASTLFWPLTMELNSTVGWRNTCLIYAALHVLVCAPLHALLPARTPAATATVATGPGYTLGEAMRHPAFWRLAAAFAANSFVFSALTVHLIALLQKLGHAPGTAVLFAALIGPMQLAGRLGELAFTGKASPQAIGLSIFAAVPVALAMLVMLGNHAWAAAGFCLLYGLSNGVMTIVRGTLPAAMFGTGHYGAIAGALAGPSLVFKAAGPLVIAWAVGRYADPQQVLVILLAVSLASLAGYLAAVQVRRAARPCGAAVATDKV